jgi:hypothetical protein
MKWTQSTSPGEEEVDTPSAQSMASGLPLQFQVTMDETPSSSDLTQLPKDQLVGIIRASTEKLEQRIQHAERDEEFWKLEGLVAQAQWTQKEHSRIQE